MRARPSQVRFRGSVAIAATTTLLLGLVPAAGAAGAAAAGRDDAGDTRSKIEPGLLDTLTAGADDRAGHDLVIEFADTAGLAAARQIGDWNRRGEAVVQALRETARTSQADVVADLRARDVEFQSYWITNTIVVEGATAEIATLTAADDDVETVRSLDVVDLEQPREVSGFRATAEPAGADGVEWGVADIHADQVWEQYDVRGEGIVVASIDSGAQFDHPALVDSYRGNRHDGTFDHDHNWFDPSNVCGFPSVTPCDNIGHGTHTIGTMVGDDGAGNRIGVAPGATWISAKGCEYNGCSEDGLAAAAQWVLAPTDLNGANPDPSLRPNIVNNSWSAGGGNDWYQDFVRAWVAAGMFPTFSAGNTGPECGSAAAPGEYAESYAVGDYDVNGQIAPTSGRGPGTWGAGKPDVAAPGTAVRSSVPGDGYAVHSGTSMAAPHVSGTVALLWSAAPGLIGDIEQTRRLLDDTARDTADDQCGGTADDNNVYGEGRLDALAVLDEAPTGQVGTLSGTVTDAQTGEPVPDVEVTISGAAARSAITDENGAYALTLTAGDYVAEMAPFGYTPVRLDDVDVVAGQTTTRDVALAPLPRANLSGTVTDGSGHGWPLYAEVDVLDSPLSTFTDPRTGMYSIDVPAVEDVRVKVTPVYPGYVPHTGQFDVTDDVTADLGLDVDASACDAPGYRRGSGGLHEPFDAEGVPDGWNIVDHRGTGQVWAFDDPGEHGNRTGGTGGFAVIDSDDYGDDGQQDTSLVTPAVDLTGVENPVVEFATDLKIYWFDHADVDVSIDGGQTWETVWRRTDDVAGPSTARVELPMAADQPDVRVRFHYAQGGDTWWWQLDDVYVGPADCEPAPGGLVIGRATSTLEDVAVNGADVQSESELANHATSVATPDDEALGDGLFWVFSSLTGRVPFTATSGELTPHTEHVQVRSDGVTWQDFALGAGRLEVSSTTVERTVTRRNVASGTVTITNTGDEPASYQLIERDGAAGPIARPAAGGPTGRAAGSGDGAVPVRRVRVDVSPSPTSAERGERDTTPPTRTDGEWATLPRYPTPIKDSAVGLLGGRLYSFGGSTGGPAISASYVYDDEDGEWSPIADLPHATQKPAGAFVDGEFIVTGGLSAENELVAATSVYDPATDSWTAAAPNPSPAYASGSAVLDGELYQIGGCVDLSGSCGSADVVRYDPAADAWTPLADYPQNTAWTSCGAIAERVYCAGGIGPDSDGLSTYAYTPETDSWEQVADMPVDLWAGAHAVVDGRLIVSGGSVNRSSVITNETFSYDPTDDTWRRLPNSNYALYRASGTCGFHKVGGSAGYRYGDPAVELLPGYTDCASPAQIDWLRTVHTSGVLQPGESRTIRVQFDARRAGGAGEYVANLRIDEDTPYSVPPVTTRLSVRPR